MAHQLTRLGAAAAIATAAVIAGSGQAAAQPTSVTIDGNMQVLGMNVLHVDAQSSPGDPTTGTYVATAKLGNMNLPIRVTGPVTCLTVRDNTVSLVYPITTMEPVMLFPPDSMAIQITVMKGQAGQPNRIGYGMPMPTSSFRGCEPGPTPLMFDGTIDIR
ncbi:hypothetical protein IU438_12635 [Nocardia cyriacigeorgica]|uniref:DUF4402 domain-containing protein n=1 Tax=Nocardia cyriacigeorgica TaxID=135487 RepID=A0A4U8W0T5_9NOCA|nr:hypothetical protein [Nocardia cyriacigeorgica]MBF6088352.1 hypothetical protein [Nocardia cyriacigeorgica]MBF6095460.1 hypothetical protein [Nocardia cyriacigeorgica]MBF6100817.1 hypothetical protein [Nocardia cyriacigeorgica]MBF6161785.1 hypothetical protein [Nocardia cyriacigeorgica]MBF6200583.1 hypothetical protein [Nocardia cyriacigeorgica]